MEVHTATRKALQSRMPEGWTVAIRYHPEFHGDVYQPMCPSVSAWIEPYVHEREAWAFLEGLLMMEKELNNA